MKNHLGDIVTMPLPTQWAPDYIPPFTGNLVIPPPAIGSPVSGQIPAGGLQNPAAQARAAGKTGVGPFAPQPLIPDNYLPPTLRRTNPLLRRTNWIPSIADQTIWREARAWKWIQEHGGVDKCCHGFNKSPTYLNYNIEMPSNGEEFRKPFSQPLSAFQDGLGAFTGLDVIVGQFVVPHGYDGVLNRFICGFTGDGFVDFSGSIVWRLKIGIRFAKDLGNVTVSYGSFQNAMLVPGYNIPLVSGQTVTLLANIPLGSPVSGAGTVTAGAFGSFNPRR